jgi:uncharacterized protein YgiB involved in biofilm formation
MKRSRQINLEQMRKRTPAPATTAGRMVKLSLLLGSGYLLTGCDSQNAQLYRTLSECTLDNPLHPQQCDYAYRSALADWQQTAPRYRSMSDCAYEFGSSSCQQYNHYYSPNMAGFMLARGDDFDIDFSKRAKPLGLSKTFGANNKWVGADGTLFGDYSRQKVRVSGNAFKPLKGGARTLGRGGFGKTIASRSSWGG